MDSFFCKIALVCSVVVGFKLFRFIFDLLYDSVIANLLKLEKVDWKSLGKWAVVTGSTDGIGKAYSEALAKKGFNVVLISRTQTKLDVVAEEIRKTYNVETKTVAVDFTKDSIYEGIAKSLQGLDVGVLVNNVGMSYRYPEYFLDMENHADCVQNLLNCNLLSVMKMCKIVMPGMVKKKKGVVINVASIAGLLPNPLLTVYATTKAAVIKFTADMADEHKKDDLIVQCVCPGFVATNMSGIRKPTLFSPSAKTYVDSALKTVGISVITTGYLPHTLIRASINTLDYLSQSLSRKIILNSLQDLRKRALKKKAQKTH